VEKSNCDICATPMSKPFIKYDHNTFPCRVSMCMNCGLIKLNPRWNESKYNRFYSVKYDYFYRGPDKSAEELFDIDLASKGKKMKERLQYISIPDKVKMLDIGAGTGFSFFSLPASAQLESYAIEASPKCLPFLKSKGVSIIGRDFSCDFGEEYDFIVARHVLEHVSNPISFLTKIRSSLKKEGYLYIAVPNAMFFNEKKAHSFFRHIHTYYYNLKTLLQICKISGLYAIRTGQDGELWAIMQRKNAVDYSIPEVSLNEQFKVIQEYVRHSHQPLRRRIISILRRIYYRAL